MIALAFALALYALRRRKEEEIDETREIILTTDLLRDQAAELWRRWRDRLRRGAAPDDPFLSLAGEEPMRRAVRAVYQEFLAAMMRLGAPRFPRQTPAAYAREAASTLPGAATALERLTAAYVAARYDPRPPAAERCARRAVRLGRDPGAAGGAGRVT